MNLWSHSSRTGWNWNEVWLVFLYKGCTHGETGDAAGKREAEAQSEEASHLQVWWTWPAGVGLLKEDHRLPKETTGTTQRDLVPFLYDLTCMSFSSCLVQEGGGYVIKEEKVGIIVNEKHTCHMLIWAQLSFDRVCMADHWKSVQEMMTPSLSLSSPAELLCQELLQHANAGTFCRLCYQLYPPVL